MVMIENTSESNSEKMEFRKNEKSLIFENLKIFRSRAGPQDGIDSWDPLGVGAVAAKVAGSPRGRGELQSRTSPEAFRVPGSPEQS